MRISKFVTAEKATELSPVPLDLESDPLVALGTVPNGADAWMVP